MVTFTYVTYITNHFYVHLFRARKLKENAATFMPTACVSFFFRMIQSHLNMVFLLTALLHY